MVTSTAIRPRSIILFHFPKYFHISYFYISSQQSEEVESAPVSPVCKYERIKHFLRPAGLVNGRARIEALVFCPLDLSVLSPQPSDGSSYYISFWSHLIMLLCGG